MWRTEDNQGGAQKEQRRCKGTVGSGVSGCQNWGSLLEAAKLRNTDRKSKENKYKTKLNTNYNLTWQEIQKE